MNQIFLEVLTRYTNKITRFKLSQIWRVGVLLQAKEVWVHDMCFSGHLWVQLSSLYGKLLVVLMIAFTLVEVMDNSVKLLSLQVWFMSCLTTFPTDNLYIASILNLIFKNTNK